MSNNKAKIGAGERLSRLPGQDDARTACSPPNKRRDVGRCDNDNRVSSESQSALQRLRINEA